jgi:hypothetical protein
MTALPRILIVNKKSGIKNLGQKLLVLSILVKFVPVLN